MRFLPTSVHGILDYVMGLILIAAPWLLGFASEGAETSVPVIIGAGVLLYSAFTDYELGLVRAIHIKAHLAMDFVGGLVLAISPWLFQFSDHVWIPHLVFGLAEMAAALVTRTGRSPDRITSGMQPQMR